MILTTTKLLILRIFNLTFGRFYLFSVILKKILVLFMIKKSKNRYVASSKYFDWEDLKK